jgi:hypothetical protein
MCCLIKICSADDTICVTHNFVYYGYVVWNKEALVCYPAAANNIIS